MLSIVWIASFKSLYKHKYYPQDPLLTFSFLKFLLLTTSIHVYSFHHLLECLLLTFLLICSLPLEEDFSRVELLGLVVCILLGIAKLLSKVVVLALA